MSLYTIAALMLCLIAPLSLIISSRLNWVVITVKEAFIISIAAMLAALIPYVGLVLALIVMIIMTVRMTDCSAFEATGIALMSILISNLLGLLIFAAQS